MAGPKDLLRQQARARRQAVADPAGLSRIILDQVIHSELWRQSRTLLFYVDARSEVRTTEHLQQMLPTTVQRIAVPWCDGDELALFELHHWDDLAPGSFKILEPSPSLRDLADRRIAPDQIDYALLPGLAFDRQGGRLGSGRGYYDRLLPRLRPDCIRTGVAFDCQMVDAVPMDRHDRPVDFIATETGLRDCRSASKTAPHHL